MDRLYLLLLFPRHIYTVLRRFYVMVAYSAISLFLTRLPSLRTRNQHLPQVAPRQTPQLRERLSSTTTVEPIQLKASWARRVSELEKKLTTRDPILWSLHPQSPPTSASLFANGTTPFRLETVFLLLGQVSGPVSPLFAGRLAQRHQCFSTLLVFTIN